MIFRLGAEIIILIHLGFVAFVALGGLLVLYRPRIALVHVPAALWGAATELFGIVCPLTPLEQRLWRLAGEAGYAGDFLEHYLVSILYPAGLTRALQVKLGIAVVLINVMLYAWVLLRARKPPSRATCE
jgi:hypothetical protein